MLLTFTVVVLLLLFTRLPWFCFMVFLVVVVFVCLFVLLVELICQLPRRLLLLALLLVSQKNSNISPSLQPVVILLLPLSVV